MEWGFQIKGAASVEQGSQKAWQVEGSAYTALLSDLRLLGMWSERQSGAEDETNMNHKGPSMSLQRIGLAFLPTASE